MAVLMRQGEGLLKEAGISQTANRKGETETITSDASASARIPCLNCHAHLFKYLGSCHGHDSNWEQVPHHHCRIPAAECCAGCSTVMKRDYDIEEFQSMLSIGFTLNPNAVRARFVDIYIPTDLYIAFKDQHGLKQAMPRHSAHAAIASHIRSFSTGWNVDGLNQAEQTLFRDCMTDLLPYVFYLERYHAQGATTVNRLLVMAPYLVGGAAALYGASMALKYTSSQATKITEDAVTAGTKIVDNVVEHYTRPLKSKPFEWRTPIDDTFGGCGPWHKCQYFDISDKVCDRAEQVLGPIKEADRFAKKPKGDGLLSCLNICSKWCKIRTADFINIVESYFQQSDHHADLTRVGSPVVYATGIGNPTNMGTLDVLAYLGICGAGGFFYLSEAVVRIAQESWRPMLLYSVGPFASFLCSQFLCKHIRIRLAGDGYKSWSPVSFSPQGASSVALPNVQTAPPTGGGGTIPTGPASILSGNWYYEHLLGARLPADQGAMSAPPRATQQGPTGQTELVQMMGLGAPPGLTSITVPPTVAAANEQQAKIDEQVASDQGRGVPYTYHELVEMVEGCIVASCKNRFETLCPERRKVEGELFALKMREEAEEFVNRGQAQPCGNAQIGPSILPIEVKASDIKNLIQAINGRVNKQDGRRLYNPPDALVKDITKVVNSLIEHVFTRSKIMEVFKRHPLLMELKAGSWTQERWENVYWQLMGRTGLPTIKIQTKSNENLPKKWPLKLPRLIINEGEFRQVLSAVPIYILEDILFRHLSGHCIKHRGKMEAMREIATACAKKKGLTIEGDGTAWDACCGPEVQELIEHRILQHIWTIIPNMGGLAELPQQLCDEWWSERCACKKAPKSHKCFPTKWEVQEKDKPDKGLLSIKATFFQADKIRHSGDRGTSVLNFLVNFVVWIAIIATNAAEVVRFPGSHGNPTRYKSKFSGSTFDLWFWFEGDDSLLKSTEPLQQHQAQIQNLWASLGFVMKLKFVHTGFFTFTGYDFLCEDGKGDSEVFMPQFRRNFASASFTCCRDAIGSTPKHENCRRSVGYAANMQRAIAFADTFWPASRWFRGVAHGHKQHLNEETFKLPPTQLKQCQIFFRGTGSRPDRPVDETASIDNMEAAYEDACGRGVYHAHGRAAKYLKLLQYVSPGYKQSDSDTLEGITTLDPEMSPESAWALLPPSLLNEA